MPREQIEVKRSRDGSTTTHEADHQREVFLNSAVVFAASDFVGLLDALEGAVRAAADLWHQENPNPRG